MPPTSPSLVPCAVLAIALAGCVRFSAPPSPPSDPSPQLGRTLERQTAMTLGGALLALPAPQRVTVLEVWATWCEPCSARMPAIQKLWEDERASGVEIVGIATDDNPGLVRDTVEARGVTYPNVVDASGEVRGWLLVRELPAVVVFDRKGRVRWMRQGMTAEDEGALRAVVDALKEEASP